MKRFFLMTGAAFLVLVLAMLSRSWADDDWKDFVGAERVALLESVRTLPATFYVSHEGNDDWSGTLASPNSDKTDGPFLSLEKARDAVRAHRAGTAFDGNPTVVELQPGLYIRETALELTQADSGSAVSPVVWRGACGEDGTPLAVVRGGKPITGGKKVDSETFPERIRPDVRDKILEFDLRSCDVHDYGTLDGENNAELFLNNVPMTVARYPNGEFMHFEQVDWTDNQERIDMGAKGVVVPKLFVDSYDMTPWMQEPDIWALGYWFWDWTYSRQRISRIDPAKKMIELDQPYHQYGYRPNQYFYVYHALCELDVPGEYYIDGESGKLYFYPPEEVTDGNLYLSAANSFVKGKELEHVVFVGLAFEGCRDCALEIQGADILLCGLVIRNTGGGGVNSAGDGFFFFGNHLYNIGAFGISARAGDWARLRTGGLAIVNNDIHHFGRIRRVYNPALTLAACGALVAQNRLSDAPHCAILFAGTENRIERNEIYSVCEESNDAGAIYTGRNCAMRGNLIKQNYLHDIRGYEQKGCVGVYLDDMFSSADIVENLFVNVTRAAMIGGGRDSSIVNNVFIDCHPSIHVDVRGLSWAHGFVDAWLKEIREKGTICGVDYKSEIWMEKYPRLAAAPEGNLGAPEGNVIERNLIISTKDGRTEPGIFWGDAIERESAEYITLRDNIVGDMRLFVEMMQAPHAVLPGTEAGFQRIPAEKIGLFKGYGAVSR